jgi:SAM-dependent methyltransferase
MTLVLLGPPDALGDSRGELGWLEEVLACSACREQTPFPCPHIENCFALRNGIVYPAEQEETALEQEQRSFWETLEKFRGTYDLPLDKVLEPPEDQDMRALLDWLRAFLGGKGPLRILQLNARRGWAARALAEDGHQVVATDLLDDSHIGLGCVARLRDQTGQRFALLRTGPAALPFCPQVFDCVFGFDLLGHIPDLERVFQEVSRVLRPGGLFVALQEPFRGALTSQTDGLLDTPFYRLARWWLPGTLPGTADPEVVYLRSRLGASLHAVRRRVPFCSALAESAGLQTTILPTAVALGLSPQFQPLAAPNDKHPAWLESLARAYALDLDRLHAIIDLARQSYHYDLLPELVQHWMLVGNMEGVLLARKGEGKLLPFQGLRPMDPERCRRFDPLLLACAADGFVPIYGVYPAQVEGQQRYCWTQPRAGLLVPADTALELMLSCPPEPYIKGPVRMEVRLETERFPLAVLGVCPGQKVSLKLPVPPSQVRHASLFVSFTANWGFLPSDLIPGPGGDTRLLSSQLHGIRAERDPAKDPATVLRQIIPSAADRSIPE